MLNGIIYSDAATRVRVVDLSTAFLQRHTTRAQRNDCRSLSEGYGRRRKNVTLLSENSLLLLL